MKSTDNRYKIEKTDLTVVPIPGHALIEPLGYEEKTDNEIIVPDNVKNRISVGRIIAINRYNVKDLWNEIKKGRTVYYRRHSAEEVPATRKYSSEKLIVVSLKDILAILSGKETVYRLINNSEEA